MKPPIKNPTMHRPDPTTISGFPFFCPPVAAGISFAATEPVPEEEEKVNLDKLLIKTPSATFVIKVEGESMKEAFIPNKALLVVDKSLPACTGDIIVALLNAELTVKRIIKTSKGIFLTPANPNFKSVKITDDMDFKIWGVVIHIIINPKDM